MWAPLVVVVMAVVIGLGRRSPQIPKVSYGPMSEELQAVCSAHGHLELLAKHPKDPITAFELLGLDPRKPPFFPSENSHSPSSSWYWEVQNAVEGNHTEMMERLSRAGNRGGSAGARDEQTKTALTMSANLLLADSPRQFYQDTVMPMLARVIRGKHRQCVWPSVYEFHRELCETTWRTIGMEALLEDDATLIEGCH